MPKAEFDEYSEPFGEQVAPHPTGQLLGNYFPEKSFRELEPRSNKVLDLLNVPIQGVSSLRNILLENKRRLLQASVVGAGIVGGVTAGAVLVREQRKLRT